MRVSLVLLVLSVGLLAENATCSTVKIASILELGVRFLILNFQRAGNITLTEDATLVIPEIIKVIITGKVRLQDTRVYGFDSLELVNLSAEDLDTTDDSAKANLCVNINMNQLQFQTRYDADVGIINEMPIYGDGELKLATSKVEAGFCVNINIAPGFSQLFLDHLSLMIKFRDSPSSITRFWKNDTASEVVTLVINILEKFVAMWITYENECISCVTSPIIEYIINYVLGYDGTKFDIDCSCLQGNVGKKFKIKDKLERLINSVYGDNIAEAVTTEDLSHFKEMFEIMRNNIIEILNKEGVSFEV